MYFDKIFEIIKKDDKKIKWKVSYYKNNIDILSQNLKMIDANTEPIFIDINKC